MTIKVNTTSCDVEINIGEYATINEYIDAIFYALIIDGFNKGTISKGFESKALELKEEDDGQG